MVRKPVSKRLRFETFKRDSFTCQYCGRKSPDVILEADHIEPVAAGGGNDILNLITSCTDCNRGKSDKSLDDRSAVLLKQRHLEELQERRNQLEMMIEWQRELANLQIDTIEEVAKYWTELANFPPSDSGRQSLGKWVKKFGTDAVLHNIREVTTRYLEHGDDGQVTHESACTAWGYLPRFCAIALRSERDPYARDKAYTIGILRKRCSYIQPKTIADWMEAAYTWGISSETMMDAAKSSTSMRQFVNQVSDLIDYCRKSEESA